MLTITTTDALETARARVTIVLQAILVAANVCGGALPHTLMIICVPRHADAEVWFELPIHPDTHLAVAHQIFHCLAFGSSLSAPDSTSDARFLLLAAHHLQSAYLWSHILPVLSRRDITLLLPDLASFDPAWPTEVCSTTFGLPHVTLDVLEALQKEWPFGVFLREVHPQMANLVRFWDSHLPLTEVQTTCVLCKDPIIRYTPVLGPHAPTPPLFCCRPLVHSACLNVYTRSQAGGRDPKVPRLFRDTPQVETHDWRAQEARQYTILRCDHTWTPLPLIGWRRVCPRTSAGSRRGRTSVQGVPSVLGKSRPTGTFRRHLPPPHPAPLRPLFPSTLAHHPHSAPPPSSSPVPHQPAPPSLHHPSSLLPR